MSGPAIPASALDDVPSPLQQELALIQPQASALIVLKDILMPMAARGVDLDTIVDNLSNLYPPELLIVPDLINMALFNSMKKILVQAGAIIPSGRGYLIVKNVIKVLYGYDPDVLKEAQDRYAALSPGVTAPVVVPAIAAGNVPMLSNHAADAATRAHRLVTRWKSEQKYTGRVGSISGFKEARMAFQDAVVDYAIPPAERVQLLDHVLRDRAYQFYHSHVLTQATSISEAYKLMEEQFCSAASQHSTKTLLDALDISSVSTEKKLSKKESLDHVYEEIARLSSQCPPEFRSDANRV
jgi:hypothetical protein